MSKVMSMFAHRQREREIKQYQNWVSEMLYWHMMIDTSLPETEIVNALGYSDCEHQLSAYQRWVEDNKHLFISRLPTKVLQIALESLGKKCNQYFAGNAWHRPDQFER